MAPTEPLLVYDIVLVAGLDAMQDVVTLILLGAVLAEGHLVVVCLGNQLLEESLCMARLEP